MSDQAKLQWVKGDNQGVVETIAEQKDGFTYFQSGRRINSELLNEFLIPINHEEQLLNIPGTNTPGRSGGAGHGYTFESAEVDDVIRDESGNEFRPNRKGPMINSEGKQVDAKTVAQIPVQPEAPKKKESPITLLINQSKKDKIKVNYEFEIEIPKSDVYKVIDSSFDVEDLDKEITDVVLDTINNKELRASVEEAITNAIKSYYKSKNK